MTTDIQAQRRMIALMIRLPSIPTAAELADARAKAEAARRAGDGAMREFYEARAACYAALRARAEPAPRNERQREPRA